MPHRQDRKELNGAGGPPKAYPDAFERPSRFKNITRYVIFALVVVCLVGAGLYIMLDTEAPSKEQNTEQPVIQSALEAVDMGLSVKWASCNVGATSPADSGTFYAWGDVTPSESYGWRDAASYDKSYATTLGVDMDAATVALGDGWRMPTREEFEELITMCTWRQTTRDGMYGYEVVASNGNSIFLPAAGYRYDTTLYHNGLEGLYWSASSSVDGDNRRASALHFNTHERFIEDFYRYYGASIRAVRE